MDDRNELNDIILNKSDNKNNQKKVLLAVATFAIILIIVVVIMNLMNNSGTDNLPKAVLPQEKTAPSVNEQDDPLFETVEVTDDTEMSGGPTDLDQVTQKIKHRTQLEKTPTAVEQEIVIVQENEFEPAKPEPKVQTPPKQIKSQQTKTVQHTSPVKKQGTLRKEVQIGATYIQVGSFSKYRPNKTFLNNITRSGHDYTYHRVVQQGKIVNKVLVGPFQNRSNAQNALMAVRKNIAPDAFIISSLK